MAASGVRSSWLASAANRRSRASLAARRRSAVSTCPSMRLNASPSWPVSVPGSVSGTPLGSRDLAGLERQLGHPGRGGGDPAQRPQRQPHPPGAEHAGEHQDPAEDPGLR